MIRSNGRPFERDKPNNLPNRKVNAVRKSYEAGTPVAAIARLHSVSRPTIYRWIEAFGWGQQPEGDEQ